MQLLRIRQGPISKRSIGAREVDFFEIFLLTNRSFRWRGPELGPGLAGITGVLRSTRDDGLSFHDVKRQQLLLKLSNRCDNIGFSTLF